MLPMTEFDPDRPCRVHDRVNGQTFAWHTGWADKVDGTAFFVGLVLDGWKPAPIH